MTRRTWLRTLAAFPMLTPLPSFAQPHKGKVKITNIRAMQVKNIAGNCLIRVDTDAGLVGYGEAGSSGPMARSRIEQIRPMLAGQDPLSIERHFHNMITLMHPTWRTSPPSAASISPCGTLRGRSPVSR